MSDEIQVSFSFRVKHGTFSDAPTRSFSADQTGYGRLAQTHTISHTASTLISLTSVGGNGYAILDNLDDTHYVIWGPDSGGTMIPVGKIDPGKSALLKLAPGINLRAQADTADVRMDVTVYED